jgi:hypothetical protein
MLLLNNRDCIHFSYFESSIEVPLFNRASASKNLRLTHALRSRRSGVVCHFDNQNDVCAIEMCNLHDKQACC